VLACVNVSRPHENPGLLPPVSEFFLERERLGVAFERFDGMSEPVVRAMAIGVRERTGARLGMAITGVAGPGGGSEEKPVGTVWIATDIDGVVEARRLRLIGDRAEVRQRAAQATLEMVRRRVLGRAAQ